MIVGRYSNDSSSMSKYVKIAALLPEKTVRDVALRCHWLSVRVYRFCSEFGSVSRIFLNVKVKS